VTIIVRIDGENDAGEYNGLQYRRRDKTHETVHGDTLCARPGAAFFVDIG
jgi:hypothetical protein